MLEKKARETLASRWLAAAVMAAAVGMLVFLFFEVVQINRIKAVGEAHPESVTPVAFQLERESLRLRMALDKAKMAPHSVDWKALHLQHDLFLSRVDLMQNGSAAQGLRDAVEYRDMLGKLDRLLALSTAVFSQAHPESGQLTTLREQLEEMSPDFNALSMTAAKQVSLTQEQLIDSMLHEHLQDIWLAVFLIVLLVAAAGWLWARGRKLVLEQDALEKLVSEHAEANQRSELANRGKSLFLANMSHELRTPLNGMLGMLGLLESTGVDALQTDYIQTARYSARHLLVLLNDVLDMSSMEAGKMTLKSEVFHLPSLLTEVEGFARPLAQDKGLQLLVTLGKNLPSWVLMDETRLKQILLNLLTNAVKFSDAGTIRMAVQMEGDSVPVQGASGVLRVVVADQGIGMDEATCARLFQRFEQGDGSSSRKFEGTGLGLEISRNLARLMQGDITVSSSPNVGTTFSVHLRVHCVEPPAPQQSAGKSIQAPAGGLDIVVAEDNATNRKFMAALLENMGHQVRFAEDGEQAVAQVHTCVPDLVLMDMHMPVMDGVLATRTIRSSPGAASAVPIIALTADVMGDIRDRAFEAGINGFMTKPLDTQALQDKLLELFPHGGRYYALPLPSRAAGRKLPAGHGRQVRPKGKPRARRALRPGAMQTHLNMNVVGEVCLIAGVSGYREMVHAFALSEAGNLALLMAGMQQKLEASLSALAHSVKGEAATLGLKGLSEVALVVEKESAAFTPEQRAQARQQLGEAWELASELLERLGLVDLQACAALPIEETLHQPLSLGPTQLEVREPGDLIQIIYSSTLRAHEPGVLKDIFEVCLRNNVRLGITGMLLFADGLVLQVLEGPSEAVRGIYERIQADARHKDLLLIVDKPVARRDFTDWSAGVSREREMAGAVCRDPYFGDTAISLKTVVKPGLALDLLEAFCSGTMGIY
jgi:signal transduction histidine kinase/CheY-like chemotaxis protein